MDSKGQPCSGQRSAESSRLDLVSGVVVVRDGERPPEALSGGVNLRNHRCWSRRQSETGETLSRRDFRVEASHLRPAAFDPVEWPRFVWAELSSPFSRSSHQARTSILPPRGKLVAVKETLGPTPCVRARPASPNDPSVSGPPEPGPTGRVDNRRVPIGRSCGIAESRPARRSRRSDSRRARQERRARR